MLELVAARLGLKLSSRVFGLAIIGMSMAVLVMLAGLGFQRGMAKISGMIDTARAAALAERDAHWRAEIAASNVVAEAERRRLVEAAAAADARAAGELAAVQKQLNELEIRNAALPDGDRCGLGRDRVRLLNTR